MKTQLTNNFISQLNAWLRTQSSIRGALLVGSHARGDATEDSEIDILLLVTKAELYLSATDWVHRFGTVDAIKKEKYGIATSVKVRFKNGVQVEFKVAPLPWATTNPVDEDTREVVLNGAKILWDADNLLNALFSSCKNEGKALLTS